MADTGHEPEKGWCAVDRKSGTDAVGKGDSHAKKQPRKIINQTQGDPVVLAKQSKWCKNEIPLVTSSYIVSCLQPKHLRDSKSG